jgi:hypothetical protein
LHFNPSANRSDLRHSIQFNHLDPSNEHFSTLGEKISCGDVLAVSRTTIERRGLQLLSSSVAKRRKGFPSETHAKRGDRVVGDRKELVEKLGLMSRGSRDQRNHERCDIQSGVAPLLPRGCDVQSRVAAM